MARPHPAKGRVVLIGSHQKNSSFHKRWHDVNNVSYGIMLKCHQLIFEEAHNVQKAYISTAGKHLIYMPISATRYQKYTITIY